jgi:hypothetical protein
MLARHLLHLDRPGPELLAPAALLVSDQERDRLVVGLPLVGATLPVGTVFFFVLPYSIQCRCNGTASQKVAAQQSTARAVRIRVSRLCV